MSNKVFKLVLIVAALFFLTGALSAQDPPKAKEKETRKAPSLAQLARESRAKTAALDTPVRTITNADLGSLTAKLSQGFADPERQAAEDEEAATGEEGVSEDGVVDEDPFMINDAFAADLEGEVLDESELSAEQLAVWQDAFREARLSMETAVNEALVLQLRMNNLENAYFSQSDGSVQERLESDLSSTMEAINANKRSQLEAQLALEALKANAAAAGLPPTKVEELVGKLPTKPPEIEIREPEPPDPDDPEPPGTPPPGEPPTGI